jgi:hypothetical protein
MNTNTLRKTTLAAIALSTVALPLCAMAQSATTNPPYSFPNTVNLAKNPSFELADIHGSFTVNQGLPWPSPAPSAAADWQVHSSNTGARVTTQLVPTTVPIGTDPAGKAEGQREMLHIIAEGNEGGVYQKLASPVPRNLMFSVWVLVKKGHVTIQPNSGVTGPSAFSEKQNEKVGEWEELRVCTDGTVPVDTLVIYNEDPKGGDFYIDRVEARPTKLP